MTAMTMEPIAAEFQSSAACVAEDRADAARFSHFLPRWARMRESLFLALANRMPRGRVGIRARRALLRLAGLSLSGKVIILGPVTIVPVGGGKNIRIGDRTFVNSNDRFSIAAEVKDVRLIP